MRKPRFSTLRIISSKEDGSPYLVIADEDLKLDLKQGRLELQTMGQVYGASSRLTKNLPNRFVSQDEELGGGTDARTSGGPCSASEETLCSKWRGENE